MSASSRSNDDLHLQGICERIRASLLFATTVVNDEGGPPVRDLENDDDSSSLGSSVSGTWPKIVLKCGHATYSRAKQTWQVRHRAITPSITAVSGGILGSASAAAGRTSTGGVKRSVTSVASGAPATWVASLTYLNDGEREDGSIAAPPVELVQSVLRVAEFRAMMKQAQTQVLQNSPEVVGCPVGCRLRLENTRRTMVDLEPLLTRIWEDCFPDEGGYNYVLWDVLQYARQVSADFAGLEHQTTWGVDHQYENEAKLWMGSARLPDSAMEAVESFARSCLRDGKSTVKRNSPGRKQAPLSSAQNSPIEDTSMKRKSATSTMATSTMEQHGTRSYDPYHEGHRMQLDSLAVGPSRNSVGPDDDDDDRKQAASSKPNDHSRSKRKSNSKNGSRASRKSAENSDGGSLLGVFGGDLARATYSGNQTNFSRKASSLSSADDGENGEATPFIYSPQGAPEQLAGEDSGPKTNEDSLHTGESEHWEVPDYDDHEPNEPVSPHKAPEGFTEDDGSPVGESDDTGHRLGGQLFSPAWSELHTELEDALDLREGPSEYHAEHGNLSDVGFEPVDGPSFLPDGGYHEHDSALGDLQDVDADHIVEETLESDDAAEGPTTSNTNPNQSSDHISRTEPVTPQKRVPDEIKETPKIGNTSGRKCKSKAEYEAPEGQPFKGQLPEGQPPKAQSPQAQSPQAQEVEAQAPEAQDPGAQVVEPQVVEPQAAEAQVVDAQVVEPQAPEAPAPEAQVLEAQVLEARAPERHSPEVHSPEDTAETSSDQSGQPMRISTEGTSSDVVGPNHGPEVDLGQPSDHAEIPSLKGSDSIVDDASDQGIEPTTPRRRLRSDASDQGAELSTTRRRLRSDSRSESPSIRRSGRKKQRVSPYTDKGPTFIRDTSSRLPLQRTRAIVTTESDRATKKVLPAKASSIVPSGIKQPSTPQARRLDSESDTSSVRRSARKNDKVIWINPDQSSPAGSEQSRRYDLRGLLSQGNPHELAIASNHICSELAPIDSALNLQEDEVSKNGTIANEPGSDGGPSISTRLRPTTPTKRASSGTNGSSTKRPRVEPKPRDLKVSSPLVAARHVEGDAAPPTSKRSSAGALPKIGTNDPPAVEDFSNPATSAAPPVDTSQRVRKTSQREKEKSDDVHRQGVGLKDGRVGVLSTRAEKWLPLSHMGHVSDYHGLQRQHDSFLPLKYNASVVTMREAISKTLKGITFDNEEEIVAEEREYHKMIQGYSQKVQEERQKLQKRLNGVSRSETQATRTTQEAVTGAEVEALVSRPIHVVSRSQGDDADDFLFGQDDGSFGTVQKQSSTLPVPCYRQIDVADLFSSHDEADEKPGGRRSRTAQLTAQKVNSARLLTEMLHTFAFIEEYNKDWPKRPDSVEAAAKDHSAHGTLAEIPVGGAITTSLKSGLNLWQVGAKLRSGALSISSLGSKLRSTSSSGSKLRPSRSSRGSKLPASSSRRFEAGDGDDVSIAGKFDLVRVTRSRGRVNDLEVDLHVDVPKFAQKDAPKTTDFVKLSHVGVVSDFHGLQRKRDNYFALPADGNINSMIETIDKHLAGFEFDDGDDSDVEASADVKGFTKIIRGYQRMADQEKIEKKQHEEDRKLKLREFEYYNKKKRSQEDVEYEHMLSRPIRMVSESQWNDAEKRGCKLGGVECGICGKVTETAEKAILRNPPCRKFDVDDIPVSEKKGNRRKSRTAEINSQKQTSARRLQELRHRLDFIQKFNQGLINGSGGES
jgi:hypothetical protein